MTSIEDQANYLVTTLERPEFELLRGKPLSAVVTGSSADSRADSHSDWDYKIFVEEAVIKAFETEYDMKYALSDKDHNPEVFVMVRRFEYLETEFSTALAATLWIYENARVLRDDNKAFDQRIRSYRNTFDTTLQKQIEDKYLKFRTRRHGIDSMIRRADLVAVRMLAQDCIKTSLHILNLLHGKPYPYPQWLHRVSRDRYLEQFPEIFAVINEISSELDPHKIQTQSRKLTGSLIDIMVTRGFDRARLEQWWMHI